jgi:proteasome activator subunit 4
MAFDMLNIAEGSLGKLNNLIDTRKVGDNDWSNEFCRAANVVDKALRGSYNLLAEINELKEGGERAER